MPDADPSRNESCRFLFGGDATSRLIADFDWSATPIGPIRDWPPSLKAVVGMIVRSPVAMTLLWGQEGVMIYNDGYAAIAGARHPGVLGTAARESWPEVAAFNDNVIRTVLAGETLTYRDQEFELHRNGAPEQVWLTLDYSPVLDDEGEPAGVIAIVIETTEKVRAERRLAADRNRFEQMFAQAPSFMAMLSGPEHRIEFANPGYFKLVGDRPILGRTVAEALPEAVAQGYLALLDRVFRSGETFSATGSKYTAEEVAGGQLDERFVDFVYQPIMDSQGAVTGIFVEGVDVTERKKAEDALQQANERLEQRVAERTIDLQNIQTFYTHSSECHAILAARPDGSFYYDELNPATQRLYGKTRDQVIGRTVDEIFGAATAAELNVHLREALRRNEPYRYIRKQGGATIEAVATPIPAEPGRLARLTVTARDITERQNLESQLRQAQKMEAVGQLTGGIAHDFNNILTGIAGSLELLGKRLAEGRTAGLERYINAAQDASRRAAALTQRLLAFSRRQTLDPKAVDVNKLIGGMEEMIRRSVGPAIEVEVVGAGGLWATKIDPSQLENALLNLCINGRDAMAPDGGRLTIETANKWLDERAAKERDLTPGQYVSVCVTDTGAGMTPEVIARAFDPFFTTKPLGEGTGLGLSMVYGFARQSGGQIRIYSELGRGTTMCVYLPRFAGPTEAMESETAKPIDHGDGETVLVIDDEPTIRMLIVEILEESGYAAIEASDGASGLKILQSGARIDLLITDVGLPGGLNGRQVADAARVARPDLKVLFITGFAENAAVGNGHLGPGMAVMTKPFVMSALGNKIRDLIDR